MNYNSKLLKICLAASLCFGITACNDSANDDPVLCNNNGIKDDIEACDGSDFGGISCADFLGTGATGSLSCSSNCTIITTGCHTPADSCNNNGVKDAVEACDGSDFGGKSCADILGAGATGSLLCSSSCEIITTGCTQTPADSCNNNGIKEGNEACDGSDFGSATCATVIGKPATGDLSCEQCKIVSTGCSVSESDICGDGEITGSEQCEPGKDITASCADILNKTNATGTPSCDTTTCQYITTGCTIPVAEGDSCNTATDKKMVCDATDPDTVLGCGSNGLWTAVKCSTTAGPGTQCADLGAATGASCYTPCGETGITEPFCSTMDYNGTTVYLSVKYTCTAATNGSGKYFITDLSNKENYDVCMSECIVATGLCKPADYKPCTASDAYNDGKTYEAYCKEKYGNDTLCAVATGMTGPQCGAPCNNVGDKGYSCYSMGSFNYAFDTVCTQLEGGTKMMISDNQNFNQCPGACLENTGCVDDLS